MNRKEFYFWLIWFMIFAIGWWFWKPIFWGIIIPIARKEYLELKTII